MTPLLFVDQITASNEQGAAWNGRGLAAWVECGALSTPGGQKQALGGLESAADRGRIWLFASPCSLLLLAATTSWEHSCAFRDGDAMLRLFILCSFIHLLIPSMISTVLVVNLSDASGCKFLLFWICTGPGFVRRLGGLFKFLEGNSPPGLTHMGR